MAAGESAREVARRRRERSERLARQAEMFERGALGEEATAAVLDTLAVDGWVHLADLRWPGRQRANIDHVAIGPGGVFVIDTKNWSGAIRVKNGVLTQNGRRREPAVAGCADAAIAVSEVVPAYAQQHVVPALCFVREEKLTGWARDVVICSTSNLSQLLLSRTPVLSPQQVQELAVGLTGTMPMATSGPTPVRRSSRPHPVHHGPKSRQGSRSRGLSDGTRLVIAIAILAALWAYFG